MALLKTDASANPKPVHTGASSLRNKSAQKLEAWLTGHDGKLYDDKKWKEVEEEKEETLRGETKKMKTWKKVWVGDGDVPSEEESDLHPDTLLFDNDSDDNGDDATPFEYPEVVDDPPASREEPKMLIGPDGNMYNPQDGFWENGSYYVRKDKARPPNSRPERPSSAPESSNTRRHVHVDPRSHTNRPRNRNTRLQTNRPRNGNAHRSGRRAEHNTFDATKQYVPDMKSIIRDFNGKEIPTPDNRDFFYNPDGSIDFSKFNQLDLSRLLRRQIAMYLHDKKSTEKNIYTQNKLVHRYETRLNYLKGHLGQRWREHAR